MLYHYFNHKVRLEIQDFVNRGDNRSYTSLMYAAQESVRSVIGLLSIRSCDLNKTNNVGCSALFYAIGTGRKECVEQLLSYPDCVNR